MADIAPLIDRLPILADPLDWAPRSELWALFDALRLDIVFQPASSAVDVATTLYDRGSDTGEVTAQIGDEDWAAPPGGFEPPTHGLGNRRSLL